MNDKTIAYLAPEIPGPSSTFVYNEIFALEKQRFVIFPFSVHRAQIEWSDIKLKALADKTAYLYEQPITNQLSDNFAVFLKSPLQYLFVLSIAIIDALRLVLTPKVAVGLLYRFLVGASLAKQLKDCNAAHLHIHFAHIPTDIGMYASLLTKIPYSVTAHANDIFQRGWLLPQKVKRSAFFGTISQFNIDWLSRLGADKSKLHIVRCGVDSERFQVREPLDKQNPVVLGFLGRLVEKKGAAVLLAACKELSAKNLSFQLQIVGDGPLQERLQYYVNENELGEKVKFMGALSHEQVSKWLNRLDYFVLPCVKDAAGDMDGIPVALMEAMLTGVPVISTSLSGIPELVIHEDTGLVCEPDDSDELANLLEKALLEDKETVLARISRAKQLVEDEYDLYKNAKRLGDLFQKYSTGIASD